MNKALKNYLIESEINKFIFLINSEDFGKFDKIKKRIVELLNKED